MYIVRLECTVVGLLEVAAAPVATHTIDHTNGRHNHVASAACMRPWSAEAVEVVVRQLLATKTETGIHMQSNWNNHTHIEKSDGANTSIRYSRCFFSSLLIRRYFENYYYYSRPAYNQREFDDRNWYYQPERYDDRPRYGDRNSAYDNR